MSNRDSFIFVKLSALFSLKLDGEVHESWQGNSKMMDKHRNYLDPQSTGYLVFWIDNLK